MRPQSSRPRIVGNEVSQARQFLQQEWDDSRSITEMANAFSLANYNRSIGMFDHLDFRDFRRMVLVGCGWLPTTLFHIHEKTDVPELVGLDIIPDAIATSNQLAKRLGYDRVRTERIDGCSYDYSQAQIVYIVRMALPQLAVLSRVADTAPDNVQVVVRDSYSLGRLWGSPLESFLDPRFEVTGKGRGGGGFYLTRDVYLRRRKGSNTVNEKSEKPTK